MIDIKLILVHRSKMIYRILRRRFFPWAAKNRIPQAMQTFNENSTLGFGKYRCLFVHIPKTGGMSICEDLGILNDHKTCNEWRELNPLFFDKVFKFCFIRDPVKRFISAYSYLVDQGGNTEEDFKSRKLILKYANIDSFVSAFVSGNELTKHHLFIPQYAYLKSNSGEFMVDYIGDMANFLKHKKYIYKQIGLKVNRETLKNKSQSKKYSLSLDSIEKLKIFYSNDYELFSYVNK